MNTFKNIDGKIIVMGMIKAIQTNKEYLSEIDGAIGDGDHGINMNKGFTLCETEIKDKDINFGEALVTLGQILFNEIGGSMGPIYGLLFTEMGSSISDKDEIDAGVFYNMLNSGLAALQEIVTAKVGDKTLVDALVPAIEGMRRAIDNGAGFGDALIAMKEAAIDGRDATKDMVAKLGRASRLGERSRGIIDAGAASCSLLLGSMTDSIVMLLEKES